MAITIKTLEILNEYIEGVMSRADHHGESVNEIVLALAGAVLWRSTTDIEVRQYKDETANVLWFHVDDKKYALTYNHTKQNIELRLRSLRGSTVHSFDNSTSNSEIKTIFSKL